MPTGRLGLDALLHPLPGPRADKQTRPGSLVDLVLAHPEGFDGIGFVVVSATMLVAARSGTLGLPLFMALSALMMFAFGLMIANFTAQPVTDPQDIVKMLVSQVTGTVRWRESIGYLAANGVTNVVEAGTGKVLSGLMKRINKEVAAQNIGTAEDVAAYKAKA